MSQHRSGLGLELSCVVDAPRARVFDLLTKPDELAKWWGPRGFTIPEVGVDLRVGGGYRFTMQPPEGEVFHLSGRFLEIEPSRLRYTFTWDEPHPDDRETVVMLELRAVGDTTEVSMSQGDFKTEERLLLHRDGWTDALAKLRELAATTDLPFVDEHRIRDLCTARSRLARAAALRRLVSRCRKTQPGGLAPRYTAARGLRGRARDPG